MEIHMNIPTDVEWILAELNKREFEAFAVGGCVRDTILGRVPGDWDVTTSATPQQMKEIFPRTVDTGIHHGTVTVIRNGSGYEVTTYRIDGIYEDGRHPKSVSFTVDLKEDLKRRDFTINAMAYSHQTGIVDIFGGMEDLKHGVIRCVGDAVERFTEDALRILRAIRFSAQLGFEIDNETYGAIQKIAPNLKQVSKERIQVELTKLLLSDHPEKIALVLDSGISHYVSESFQNVCERACVENEEVLLRVKDLEPVKWMRWAGFLRFSGPEPAVKVLKELKLDNDTIGKVKTLLLFLDSSLTTEKSVIRKTMSQMPDELFSDLLKLRRIHNPSETEHLRQVEALSQEIIADGDCIRMKDLAVSGNDLIAAGIPRGKAIGEQLERLFAMVLEDPGMNEREQLISEIL